MKRPLIFISLIIILVIYILLYNVVDREKFAGALTQLYAKGPQDTYLYGDVDRYIYPGLFRTSKTI